MKRVLVVVLALLMVLALVPTVALAEGKEEKTTVKASTDVRYTITIPSTVDFGTLVNGQSKSRNFTVKASNVVLEDGGYIDVSATGNGRDGAFEMYDFSGAGSNAVPFQLKNSNGNIVPGESYYKFTKTHNETGSVSVTDAEIKFAGSYSGIMTFAIEYVAPVVLDAYSPEGKEYVDWIVGFSKIGTVDFQFKDWVIGDLESVEVSVYMDGKRITTTELLNIAGRTGKSLTCTLKNSDNWKDEDPSVDDSGGHYAGKFNEMRVKVVKDGKTYIFTSDKLQ